MAPVPGRFPAVGRGGGWTVTAGKVTGRADVTGIIADAPAGHPAVKQLSDQGTTVIQAVR